MRLGHPHQGVAQCRCLAGVDGNAGAAAGHLERMHVVEASLAANSGAYWVGEAMRSTDYNDHDQPPEATLSAITTLAANAAHLARLLVTQPYPAS